MNEAVPSATNNWSIILLKDNRVLAGSLFGILQRIAELDATVARPGYRLSAARAGGAGAGKLLAPDGASGGTGIDLLRPGVPPGAGGLAADRAARTTAINEPAQRMVMPPCEPGLYRRRGRG